MNLSLKWLNDYVDVSGIPLAELAAGLTLSGSKVEKIIDLSEPMSKVVIGKITEIKQHENAEKLRICKVQIGADADAPTSCVQIVTAAPNVFEGAVVPVVLDGGTVINSDDGSPLKIKKGKLRGEVSEGMLCGPDELGVEIPDFDGIWILDGDYTLGGCALEQLGLDDKVIEFEITNNRPDCFSIVGLAREVAATFDLPLKIPTPAFTGVDGDISSELKVGVEASDLCSRYMAAVVHNVKVAPSPEWMQRRLKAQGVRPINNIVDITNYVMLEHGNPLHAFDKRHVNGDSITVRRAGENEQIKLLDGNTATLSPDNLVIADTAGAVAVAGVMGGEYSGVTDDTTSVVFEAACFDSVSVRKTAKKIGRRTESSARFEKGLSPENTKTALLRALQLVEELQCGNVVKTLIDCANFTAQSASVPHDFAWINSFLGTELSESEQVSIFRKLGLGYCEQTKAVLPPSTRSDIALPCDLAEEIARIYGYDKITATVPRLSRNAVVNTAERAMARLVQTLTAYGCYECVSYSFVSPDMAGGDNADIAVKLRNPFGPETSVMRTSLIPSMLKIVADNINLGNNSARLFELGRVYSTDGERDMLCVGLYGKEEDFYTLGELVRELLGELAQPYPTERHEQPPFHPGRAAGGEYVTFGEISPLVLDECGISERVYVAVVDLSGLKLAVQGGKEKKYTPTPKFPSVTRDLSLVCDKDTPSGDVVEIIKTACKKYLAEVSVFDVFDMGESKSLSYKLTFRKPDGTLTGVEVDKAIAQILNKLEQNNIKLRS